jgi:hypothetical protein
MGQRSALQTRQLERVEPAAANDMPAGMVLTTTTQLAELIRNAVSEAQENAPAQAAPRLLDRVELARALACSPSQVDKLRRRGMPHIRVGESPRFEVDACLAWLRQQKETD